MASSYTTNFGIEEMATGDQSGAWGTTTNYNFDILDRVASYTSVALSGTTHTLTVRAASPTSGSSNVQDGMYRVIKFTGALGANNTVTIGPNTSKAYFIFINATTDSGSSGPYSVILSQGSGANVTIANGKSTLVYCDGAGSGAAVVDALANLQLSSLIVNGVVTDDGAVHDGDVTFTGASYNVVWDKSDNALEFGDNAKATFGAGGDLSIYHDGSNSYINDTATGNLKLAASQVDILGGTDGAETMATFVDNGAATLYHDNTARIATTSAGIDVTGTVTMDGGATSADFSFGDDDKALFGAGNDLQIYHDGSNSYILENGTGNLIAKGNAGIYLRGTNDEEMATFLQDGAVTLYHDNTARIATTSAGVDVTGTVTDDGATHDGDVTLTGASYNVVWDKSDNALEFADNAKAVFGTGGDLSIYHDGSSSVIRDSGTGNLAIQAEDFAVQSADASATHIFVDSSSGYTSLGYGGSAKIATSASGVTVTGAVSPTTGMTLADDVNITFGTGSDATIDYDGSNLIFQVASDVSNFVFKDSSGNYKMWVDADEGDLVLWSYDSGTDGPNLILKHLSGSPADNDALGRVYFVGDNSADEETFYTAIYALSEDVTDGSEDGSFFVYGLTDGTNKEYFSANYNGDKAVRLSYDGTAVLATVSGGIEVGNTTSASVDVGGDLSTGTAKLEIGTGRSGSGYSYIDLVGDTTYSDYGLRIIRSNTGANAPTSIEHRGTGNFTVKSTEAANILFQTTNAERMRILSGGQVGIGTAAPAAQALLEVGGVVRGTYTQGGIPSTFWSQTAGYFSNGTGSVSSEGSYGIHITSNGYRNASAEWTSLAANSQAGAAQIGLYPPGYITFGTESSKSSGDTSVLVDEKMRLTAGGSLGIGTNTPNQALTIGKNSAAATLELRRTNAVSGANQAYGSVTWAADDTNLVATLAAVSDAADGNGGDFVFLNTSAASSTTNYGSPLTEKMRISSEGVVTKANQPAFQAVPSADQTDIAVGEYVTIAFGTERFDAGSNFASNTFTAPTTGKYMLSVAIRLQNVDAAASYYTVVIKTDNKWYHNLFSVVGTDDLTYLNKNMSVVADMDANDTAFVEFYQSGGAAQTDIDVQSWFSGYLLG